MPHRVKLNLFDNLHRLDGETGRHYSMSEVSRLSGVSRTTIDAILKGSTSRIDTVTLEKLLDFFAAEGMPVSIGELFTVTDE